MLTSSTMICEGEWYAFCVNTYDPTRRLYTYEEEHYEKVYPK